MDKTIKFSEIQKLFPGDKWDVGFLSPEQLKQCAYSPIKGKAQEYGSDYTNNIHFLSIVNSIVIAGASPDSWDYSLYKDVDEILTESGLKDWFPIYTNFKEAAVLSGLGVRARNSLIYGYKFGFDMKVCVVGFDLKITGCPAPKRLELGFWDRCEGCSDCRLACPAGAIHNEKEPYWIDSGRCDDFIGFGDHDRIPSIKKFWHKHVHPEVPKERVEKMTSCTDLGGELVFDANGYTLDLVTGVQKDGVPIPIPFCRECQAQPRCSKWNGRYPYESV